MCRSLTEQIGETWLVGRLECQACEDELEFLLVNMPPPISERHCLGKQKYIL